MIQGRRKTGRGRGKRKWIPLLPQCPNPQNPGQQTNSSAIAVVAAAAGRRARLLIGLGTETCFPKIRTPRKERETEAETMMGQTQIQLRIGSGVVDRLIAAWGSSGDERRPIPFSSGARIMPQKRGKREISDQTRGLTSLSRHWLITASLFGCWGVAPRSVFSFLLGSCFLGVRRVGTLGRGRRADKAGMEFRGELQLFPNKHQHSTQAGPAAAATAASVFVGTISSVVCPSRMAGSRRRSGHPCYGRRPGVCERDWRLMGASALAGLNLEIGGQGGLEWESERATAHPGSTYLGPPWR